MAYTRKPGVDDRLNEWGPWTAVRFQTEHARDDFLGSVALLGERGWGAEAMLGDGRGAQVRWLRGRFLRLNDLANTHGGRVVVSVGQHWLR